MSLRDPFLGRYLLQAAGMMMEYSKPLILSDKVAKCECLACHASIGFCLSLIVAQYLSRG